MAEARALKLCTKEDYIKSGQRDDKSLLKRACFAHVIHFLYAQVWSYRHILLATWRAVINNVALDGRTYGA